MQKYVHARIAQIGHYEISASVLSGVNEVMRSGPDSAGGISLKFELDNLHNQVIKYATISVTPRNAVFDTVPCTVTLQVSKNISITGPISPKDKWIGTVKNAWYNHTIKSVSIDAIAVEYMNGEKVTLTADDLTESDGKLELFHNGDKAYEIRFLDDYMIFNENLFFYEKITKVCFLDKVRYIQVYQGDYVRQIPFSKEEEEKAEEIFDEIQKRAKKANPDFKVRNINKAGCYIATCVYGSYDCPEVWTLRRYRDNTLASTWYGKAFIRLYYAISPTIVKLFGHTDWFKNMWRKTLDKMVTKLNNDGVENTPYNDKNW